MALPLLFDKVFNFQFKKFVFLFRINLKKLVKEVKHFFYFQHKTPLTETYTFYIFSVL